MLSKENRKKIIYIKFQKLLDKDKRYSGLRFADATYKFTRVDLKW